uniref:Uncharacterized protein n=1 Tax=Arundo donax TaxID=35708 RepID=A0A0A9GXJ6_ARUDO
MSCDSPFMMGMHITNGSTLSFPAVPFACPFPLHCAIMFYSTWSPHPRITWGCTKQRSDGQCASSIWHTQYNQCHHQFAARLIHVKTFFPLENSSAIMIPR